MTPDTDTHAQDTPSPEAKKQDAMSTPHDAPSTALGTAPLAPHQSAPTGHRPGAGRVGGGLLDPKQMWTSLPDA